jgi:hypothetical protein
MSDTPETDAAQFGTGRVSVDFARRLERERDEARVQRDYFPALSQSLAETCAKLKTERDEAREKNARLREIISRANRDYDEQIELFRAEGNKLRDIAERAIENCECEPKCASHYGAHCDCGRTKRSVELRAELDRLGWRLTS